jgi:hypothetical protein
MFKLHFELNGQRVDSRTIGNAIHKAIIEKVTERITKAVGSVRCPDHGSAARIVAKGNDLSHLTFAVSGCCDKLISEVKARLSREMR